MVQGYAMIGNAVPPLLGHLLAQKLEELHTNNGLFNGGTGVSPEEMVRNVEKVPQIQQESLKFPDRQPGISAAPNQ